MGRTFRGLKVNNDDSSSAFSNCNSDRSGELPTTSSSQSRRLLISCASDNSDEFIYQLVSDLNSSSTELQKQAAWELRLLAKNKPENRIRIARAGAIRPLIDIISSADAQLQGYGVTAILNLSLCDENKETIASAGAIKPLIMALTVGNSTARENAACALLRLSQVVSIKVAIGRSGAIPPLVNLLENGSFRGKKDASTALYSLCSLEENKIRAVQAGIMKPLVELMADFGSNMVEKSAFVLRLLVSVAEARAALVAEGGIPVLMEIVEVGTQQQKEVAASILLQLCEDSLTYRTMMAREGVIPPLVVLSQTGTSRAKQELQEEKLRIAVLVSPAALSFIQDISYTPPAEVKDAGFQICADELGSIVEGRNLRKLRVHGGVEGIGSKLSTSLTNGISTSDDFVERRHRIYAINRFTESPANGFWVFVWEALQDTTLMILAVCALISLVVGIAAEGWPKGAHDGLGIVASILLVVFVTATGDYRQSLQFKDLDKEMKKIAGQVTRNGYRQKISMYDLLPGDIVHLAVGDQVPADGLFLSGNSLLIDESCLTGESEPINVTAENPFLLSGTEVQEGSCKMLVTTVGKRTLWGKWMATLSEGGDDETPLQVKLNGVATIIGKIGLFFALITFAVLVQGLFSHKLQEGSHSCWCGDDALEMLEYFAVAVTIVVVAVPEGLPLAVTLSLAFAMKKMMNDKALARHVAACETMGSATTICSDKTTLTTNHMTVVKTCICSKTFTSVESSRLCSEIPYSAIKILLQSIFNNTGGEVVKNEGGKVEILGTRTETALLEFALSLGGDFHTERQSSKLVKVEPFNSVKKRMGVVLQLQGGDFRAHCKGTSEIILAACDKVLNTEGEIVPLDEASINHLKDTIEQFASEGLRTLCLAYKEIGSEFSADSPIPFEGYTCIGIVGITDPVRPGVKESVATCKSAGITVRMVTGDNINTAKAIARECGILTDDGIAIEAPDFRLKSEEELLEIIPKLQVMARSSPMDKHTLVKHLRTTFQEVVAVTGDGTNDAPALHEADIGLAMGISGTEVAKENADVIILDDNFSTIVTVARWGRSVYVNIQKFVQFQLTVNVVALIVNFSSACLTGNAPLTAVQLLWVNMIMDTLGALALATEPPNDDLMKRPPVGRKGNFISNVMWRNILGQSIYQFVIIWYLQTSGKSVFHLDGSNSDLILNTLIFNSFVFCQVFNEISSREMENINVFKGILKNYVFVAVIGCTVLFQIIIVEFLGTFANTCPLTWQQWFASVCLGFLGMPIAAAIKMIPVGSC